MKTKSPYALTSRFRFFDSGLIGGVEHKYDTPHTSLSGWALLDEGAFFMHLPDNALCVGELTVRK